MLVTCEQCQTVYKLEDRLLGLEGRKVRCTECLHVWMQPPPEPPPAQKEIEQPDWLKDDAEEDSGDIELVMTEKGQYFHEDEMPIPEGVKPVPPAGDALPADYQIPVMAHRPLGMAAGQFGACVFLLLACVTLSALLVAKHAVVNHMPAMALFYRTIGIPVAAPGEGLALSDLAAEVPAKKGARKLTVSAKLGNMTAKPLPPPPLELTVTSQQGEVLKTWNFKPGDADIGAGESMPVEQTFDDLPEGGASVSLAVKDR